MILRLFKSDFMDDSKELALLEEKIDQVAERLKTLRQSNETFKMLLLEKDEKITHLQQTLRSVEERVQHLLNQLPKE